MSYYDPVSWIDSSDSLVDNIESEIKETKVVVSDMKGGGRAYLPSNELELDVRIEKTGESLRLTEWMDRIGRFHLGLVHSGTSYRRGDFQEKKYHHNPNGIDVPPPHHIHFPTIKYSLEQRHTYAYPVKPTINDPGGDYISALRLFCYHNNIALDRVTLPLIRKAS